MDFLHISPTSYLSELVGNQRSHLLLAHLVEDSPEYKKFYQTLNYDINGTVILDNSAFEMYKQGKPMYPSNKLLEMGSAIAADYIVMSDYPDQPGYITIEAAEHIAPAFKEAGFGTFFVPQSRIGAMDDLLDGFEWALFSPLVDYIGFSILNIPNGYGVERNNKLQRFLSRWHFVQLLDQHIQSKYGVSLRQLKRDQGKKFHFLGMVDGPNEIDLIKGLAIEVDTWDSSAAIWAGLNGKSFDSTPTGLVDGKFELEVDFDFANGVDTTVAKRNIEYINRKCGYNLIRPNIEYV